MTALVNAVTGRSAWDVFGSPDDLKFHSWVTLFDLVQGGSNRFEPALAQYFAGRPDPATLAKITALEG